MSKNFKKAYSKAQNKVKKSYYVSRGGIRL